MKMNNKRIMSIMLVVMLTLSGLLAIAPASSAKPKGNVSREKIKIESVIWDTANQEFVVSLSLKSGLATAGEHADFLVATTLDFDADGNPVTLSGESTIVKAEGATKDADNMITLNPTFIPWDRNSGKYEGLVDVDVSVVIEKLTSGDGGEAGARLDEFTVMVRESAGCTSDTDCDDGNICNGEETCNVDTGECEAGTPLPCDDGHECSVGNCDPSTGCDYTSPCSPPPPTDNP